MGSNRHLVCSAAIIMLAPLLVAAAPADTRRCLVAYTDLLRQVSLQAGLSARACVRDTVAGVEPDLEACIAGDRHHAVAARRQRVAALYAAAVCRGDEPLQQGAAVGNAAHRQVGIALAHDLFGAPVGQVSGSAEDAACLDAALRAATVDLSAITHAHRLCLDRGLQGGTITDLPSLANACGARAQVDAAGRAPAVLARSAAGVRQACAGRAVATLFDGLAPACKASADALATCIERAAACRACRALNATHGRHRDCDAFDDGAANGSCDVLNDPAGVLCTLGHDSRMRFDSIGLPLSLQLAGSLRITCGPEDAGGIAPCRCDLQERLQSGSGALVIPAIGDVCINPHAGCAAGAVACDGGRAVDVDVAIDHDIGSCDGNAACAEDCAAHCAGLGAAYTVAASACEGFCQGGVEDGSACTSHSQCPGARCAGPVPRGDHSRVCNCTCQAGGLGVDAGAGALTCGLGTQIDIELPSNGRCGDTIVASYPPFCVALTTGMAPALIANANNHSGSTIRTSMIGMPAGHAIACDQLAVGSTAGLSLIGGLAILDSTLGDALLTPKLVCE